jgi:hypothetical protein
MFQSCTYKYKSYDRTTDQYRYNVTITDPDFGEETVEAAAVVATLAVASVEAVAAAAGVIKCYSSKGYSVNQIAKNLWLFFEFNQQQYLRWSIKEQTEWCLEHLPEYLPYHADIQMLMLFS